MRKSTHPKGQAWFDKVVELQQQLEWIVQPFSDI